MSTEERTPPKRRYEQRKRAALQADTRLRITEATAQLHRTVGPARTTISAIAELAGVRRATVYRHFPDERSLFLACSGHFAEANPRPDPARWWAIGDAEQRLRVALDELYGWYERTEPMMTNILRDADSMPIIHEIAAPRFAYMASLAEGLERGWDVRGRRLQQLRAALALALDFRVWHTLWERQLDRSEAVELMVTLVRASTKKKR